MENIHLERVDKSGYRRDDKQLYSAGPVSGNETLTSGALPRNCWLCEGWLEYSFEVRLPEKFIGCEVTSVYLHLAFEDFKPMVMREKVENLIEEQETKLRVHRGFTKQEVEKHGMVKLSKKNQTLEPVIEGENLEAEREADVERPKAQKF